MYGSGCTPFNFSLHKSTAWTQHFRSKMVKHIYYPLPPPTPPGLIWLKHPDSKSQSGSSSDMPEKYSGSLPV